MDNYLNDYMLSPDKQGRKPTILVNIADDDVTRGDTAGRLGLARIIAQKINGEVLYADEKKLTNLYSDSLDKTDTYEENLEQYLSNYRSPDIMLGLDCSRVLGKIGKKHERMLYVTGYNERLSSTMLDERSIVSHHLTDEMLQEEGKKFDTNYPKLTKPIIALFLVDPQDSEQDFFVEKISAIAKHHKEATIFLCGSRRTGNENYSRLKDKLIESVPDHINIEGFQFDRKADFNPYRGLIARAEHFILWGNSMSMMSEPLVTGKTVHLYNYGVIEDSLIERSIVSDFKEHARDIPLLTKNFTPINVTEQLADKLLEKFKKQNERFIEAEETKYNLDKLPKKWHKHLIKIQIDPNHINNVPTKIRSNGGFIKYALHKNGLILQHLSEKIRNNIELSQIAIQNNPLALPFTGKAFHDNDEAMFNILSSVHILNSLRVKQTKDFYITISDRLKKCPDFTLRLLKNYVDIVALLDQDLFNHRDISLAAVKVHHIYFERVPEIFTNDDDFVKESLKESIHCFQSLTKKYREDPSIIDYILKRQPYLIEYATDKIRDDMDIMIKFITKERTTFPYASKRLQNKKGFILECFKHANISNYIPKEMWNDKDIALAGIKECHNNISFVRDTILNCDLDLCQIALSQDSYNWHLLSEKAQENIDISFIAFKNQKNLWQYLRHDIRQDKDFLLRCATAVPHFSIKQIDNKHFLNQKFIKDITNIRPEWKDAPEFADTLRLIRYKENLSSVFNTVTAPIKIIKAFKQRFQKKQEMKL